jgi:DNA replication and repair protein RecF
VWDQQLATVGGELVAARNTLLTDLTPHVARAYAQIAGGGDAVSAADVSVSYQSALGPDVSHGADRDAWCDALLTAIESRRREELGRGLTLVGPHRDELAVSLGSMPAKGFASHGESWSIALSLRLAGLEVLRSDGDDPVLILDDVFAELDSSRRRRLAAAVVDGRQVLITAAVDEDVPDELRGRRLLVTMGQVNDT